MGGVPQLIREGTRLTGKIFSERRHVTDSRCILNRESETRGMNSEHHPTNFQLA